MDHILQSALNVAQDNSELRSLMEKEIEEMMVCDDGELFSIFYGSSIATRCTMKKPKEKELLYLLLNYLLLKVENKEKIGSVKRIFSLSDKQRNEIRIIIEVLKQWLVDLIVVNSITKSNDQSQKVENYAIELQDRLQHLRGIFILPTGLAEIDLNDSHFKDSLMLEESYKGPHCAASIIENDSKEFKNLVQIDPISPYQWLLPGLPTDKISLGLQIKNIPSNNFDVNFLVPLMTLRSITGKAHYKFAYLYEVVLSRLSGQGILNNEKEFFIDREEVGCFILPWTLVKSVVFYLLKRFFDSQQAQSLYSKILCEFQFNLLTKSFNSYLKLENDDISNRIKYQFLLHEMCNKVAYDTANTQEVDKKVISDYLLMVQDRIDYKNRNFNKIQRNEKFIKPTIFQHSNFQSMLDKNLKELKFIQENITDNLNSLKSTMIRKQVSFYKFGFEEHTNEAELDHFNQLLDELTKYYGFNRVIQICQLIEDFIFSITKHNGFRSWKIAADSNIESCRILVRMAILYYNCSGIVASELHSNENCAYEPTFYTKLVLILFSLYALLENMVRNDELIGPTLADYKISTELKNICLKSILPQLTLPERKWFDLLKKIEDYFEVSKTDFTKSVTTEKLLFHFSSLEICNDADQSNVDVKYMLDLLKNNFKEEYKKFERTHKEVKKDELHEQWYHLLFTGEYVPIMLKYLREISYLSRLSLAGFSVEAINTISSLSTNGDMYSRFHWSNSRPFQISDLNIKVDSVIDARRFVDFTLPPEQDKYQRLVACDYVRSKKSLTENEIIGTQNEKPDKLTRPQYYHLCSIQLYDDLRLQLLYIALKNEEINFEIEEHCYLIKQALYKLGASDKVCLLEKQFHKEKFSLSLVNKFIETIIDLKERVSQYSSMGHILDILLFLYDFCSDNVKNLIEKCLAELRETLLKYIDEKKDTFYVKENSSIISILSCYYILTYKILKITNEKEVSQILKLRILIDNNSKLHSFVPSNLYVKMMATLFRLNSEIEDIINSNLCMLDAFVENTNGSWVKDASTNLYAKGCYSFVPLKGRLFNNGQPMVCLPSQIVNHPDYKTCFGTQNFLVEFVNKEAFGKTVPCYEGKAKDSTQIRLSSLANGHIWIENENQTFVSNSYLCKLPKILLQNYANSENENVSLYTYWYENEKIFIKNEGKTVKFEIDLNSNEVRAAEDKMFLIPFGKDGFDKSNTLYMTFSRFEDENYILVLKNQEQDTEPVMIYLPRMNLKFKVDGTKIISENFKDYRLSEDQHIDTLVGLSQYLVIEPDIQTDSDINFNRKVIIPYHPIEKKQSFFSHMIEFNLDIAEKPAYFAYEVDENLKCLNSETTAGSLYLALLYFKTATLDKDLFFEMNSYEICVEILKTCWQNCQYSDIEFSMILKFFEDTYPQLDKFWSACLGKEEELFKNAKLGSNCYHRNTHAIFLRLIYLLLSSYETDFLIKPDTRKHRLYQYLSKNNFIKYHFNRYLFFKNRIDKRCRLSLEEEKKLLSHCLNNCSNHRISDYYQYIDAKQDIKLSSIEPMDYRRLENSFFSRTMITQCDFSEEVKIFLKDRFPRPHVSLNNKTCKVENRFSEWVSIKFEFAYFVSLYKIALNINAASDFDRESFSYFLAYLFSNSDREDNIFIKILYVVSTFPEEFNPLPDFLLSQTNEINSEQKYQLDSDSMRFRQSDIRDNLDDPTNEAMENSIWLLFVNEYLDKEQQLKFSIKDLRNPALKLKFRNSLEATLKEVNIIIHGHLPDALYEKLISKTRNKELYEFIIDVANRCNEICKSRSNSIGYIVMDTIGLSDLKINLSWKDIENQVNREYSYSESNKDFTVDVEWKVKSIDIDKHYALLAKLFRETSRRPEKIPFPLDPETLPDGSLVREVFSNGYGKSLIFDLQQSYGDKVQIVKINEQFYFFSEKQQKKGIDILKELGCDFEKEFDCIERNFSEIKDEILLDVVQWIKNETSQKFIYGHEEEQIRYLLTAFEDRCKKINNELIKRQILSQSLALEPLIQKLEALKDATSLGLDVEEWLLDLRKNELHIRKTVKEKDILFKKFLNFHRENFVVSPCILKLVCKKSQFSILVYEKVDKSNFELKEMKDYCYRCDTSESKRHFWLHGDVFQEIEIRDIDDNTIREKLKSNPCTTGYLQTPITEICLKTENDLNSVHNILIKYYSDYREVNGKLLKEIYQNISSVRNTADEANLFVLHRIVGETFHPTKKEILSLIKDIDKIKEFNPFILFLKEKFREKVHCYLIQETLIQQIARVILLISKYKSLNLESNEDEKAQLLENILSNTLMRRRHDHKEYPSWLLFETENNLLIRDTQYSLVETMIKEETNSMYQLNMGEGKTSVILPIFSEIIADGKQIARINCLDPLIGVMQELLRTKFGGLLQKKLYVMPFSRRAVFSIDNLKRIKNMLRECQNGKHILLVTPEQRLCFQLKKQEMLLEYLQSKDADDCFSWEEHHNQAHRNREKYVDNINNKKAYMLTGTQHMLKNALVSLEYINNNDRILKYPSEDINEFLSEVNKMITEKGDYQVKVAYHVLRDRSLQLKSQRQQKLDLLYSIDEFKFFDILDESDEILRHEKELNYTFGSAEPLDGGSIRWEIPFLIYKTIFSENKFSEFLKSASQRDDCPVIFQENFRPVSGIGGGSPLVRFINHDYFRNNIKPDLAQRVCKILLSRFHEKKSKMIDCDGESYGTYEDFVLGNYAHNENKIIEFLKKKSQEMLNSFLLTKAWLSHELLYHVMNHRYRVEYGLSDKGEKEIAIPFRGKDLPSENSEFSHPDIMIGFTILSYLYRGLDLKQVKDGLIKLKTDSMQNKDSPLKQWVQENKKWIDERIQKDNEEFPAWLNSFKTLDLEDENRVKKVHLYLSRNLNFIEYYLSNFTFPNETKYYKEKLTGNAHTLAGEGETKGFSGTDDRNDTMPESVVPKRLPSQEGTNGKMLHILSRERNSKYESRTEISSTMNLLNQVCEYATKNENCYVLVDAGAIITEMSNFDVSEHLIRKIHSRFEGVVHFSDKSNKIMVILTNGDYLPLSVCHIDNKKLFVYLDEVHTRGTDLKLPLTAHGIVTLGKNMNKDKLLQAVMRLRDLEFKQSIVLWGTNEISAEISTINGIERDQITSKHVLAWVTYNTIRKNEKDLYLVTREKLKYVIKNRVLEYQKKVKEIPMNSLREAYVSESLDKIETLYKKTPKESNPRDLLYMGMGFYLDKFYPKLKEELKRKEVSPDWIKDIENNWDTVDRPKMKGIVEKVDKKLPGSILTINDDYDCDQETERETEEMQHVELAPIMQKPPVHEDIWNFEKIFTENFKEKGLRKEIEYPQLAELRECFKFTNLRDLGKLKWHRQVLVTANFIKTIEEIDKKNQNYQNEYLKLVNMILIHRKNKEACFIIVSVLEAHYLIQLCQEKSDPKVSLMHIDDVNGPTMAPINAVPLTNDEITNIITIIRLFNGDCRYDTEEIKVIKKCLGFVERDRLHRNTAISEQIYSELESRNYLMKGFMTPSLINKLSNPNEKILLKTEVEQEIDLQSLLHSIINDSIAEDAESVWKLPRLIKELIHIRGKSEQYHTSDLKRVLENTVH